MKIVVFISLESRFGSSDKRLISWLLVLCFLKASDEVHSCTSKIFSGWSRLLKNSKLMHSSARSAALVRCTISSRISAFLSEIIG